MNQEREGADKYARLRSLAEQALVERPVEGEWLSVHETNTLLHELEVYHVELEMQNEELRRVQQELEATRDNYAFLYDNAPVGYVSLDSAGRILEANLTAAVLLGVSRSGMIGGPLASHVSQEFQDQFFQHLRRTFAAPGRQSMRFRFRKAEGGSLCVQVESQTVPVEKGGQRRCLTTLSDLTQQESMEETLRQAQKLEALGTMISGVAHEFNNDLAIILGHAELAQLVVSADSKLGSFLQAIFHAGVRARKVIGQLMLFARRQSPEQRVIDPLAIVKGVVNLLRVAVVPDIQVQVQDDGGDHSILGDSTELHQVLFNLANNAAQAMPIQGGKIDICLANVRLDSVLATEHGFLDVGSYVRLSVLDTGGGIPEKIRNRIFDPFFTTKEIGKGSGMGLAVVFSIVQGMGGGMVVESASGKGTAFHVYFPASQKKASAEIRNAPRKASSGKWERVLVVDDEEALANLVKMILEQEGYRVTACTDAKEALKVFLAAPEAFDLLITDLSMPGLSGEALIAQVHAHNPGLPVLIYTGQGEAMENGNGFSPQVQAVLVKPVFGAELLMAVRKSLVQRA